MNTNQTQTKETFFIKLLDTQEKFEDKMLSLQDEESGFTVLQTIDDTLLVVCHGTIDGGLSIDLLSLCEILAQNKPVELTCCYPQQVYNENKSIFNKYKINVLGEWDTPTRIGWRKDGIIIYPVEKL